MSSPALLATPAVAAIANHLWQSTVVFGAAWLLSLTLRNAPARVRFWVWMTASIKFLVPMALVGAFAATVASLSHDRFVLPAHGTEHSAAVWVQRVSQPLQQRTFASSVLDEAASQASPVWDSVQKAFLPMLAGIWFPGFAVVAFAWLRQWLKICLIAGAARPLELGLAGDVEVRVSTAVMEPAIFGIVHPVLLLPEGIFASLSRPQMRAVMEHEICHVRRRDNLTALLHMCTASVFWFHPAVWWIKARLLEERELACDEAVLGAGNEAELYAASILTLCRMSVESPVLCLSGITGADLKRRIVHIMTAGPRTLGLRRKLLLGVAASLAVAVPALLGLMQMDRVHAQTAPPAATAANANVPSTYDVVSIHPTKPGASNSSTMIGDGKFDGENVDLGTLFSGAYGIRGGLIFGLPSWANGKSWDIHAKMVDLTEEEMKKFKLTGDQDRQFLVNMLADRFHAKVHWETKQLPVYDLIVDKNGPKLAQNATQNAEEIKTVGSPGGWSSNWGPDQHKATFREIEIKSLASYLSNDLNRDVIDQTGITGKYSFELKFAPQDTTSGSGETGPSLFTAVQEQLGLKLVPAKGPIETLVIDHVDPPTEN